tara:strand:+ start:50 stop:355 length:306 start_codon:yes stop_codon:yes gene_type:complete
MLKDLIKIVDMYLDTEQRHYEENPSDDHIFHSLLKLSLWIKGNHTMKSANSLYKEYYTLEIKAILNKIAALNDKTKKLYALLESKGLLDEDIYITRKRDSK